MVIETIVKFWIYVLISKYIYKFVNCLLIYFKNNNKNINYYYNEDSNYNNSKDKDNIKFNKIYNILNQFTINLYQIKYEFNKSVFTPLIKKFNIKKIKNIKILRLLLFIGILVMLIGNIFSPLYLFYHIFSSNNFHTSNFNLRQGLEGIVHHNKKEYINEIKPHLRNEYFNHDDNKLYR
jgi:hypothetical protein